MVTWLSRVESPSAFLAFSDIELAFVDSMVVQPDTKFNDTVRHGYKEMSIFDYIARNETLLSNFDWFFKADDDSYVLPDKVENFVNRFNPNNIHYFGRMFQSKINVRVVVSCDSYFFEKIIHC
jgi:hypothetical protein